MRGGPPIEARALLDALPNPVFWLDEDDYIVGANQEGERFLGLGRAVLARKQLTDVFLGDSPLVALIGQVRGRGAGITEHLVELSPPRTAADHAPGERLLDIYAGPIIGASNFIIVVLQERSLADKMTRQMNNRGAARSISAMAAILAHEIKNPLSGIRGASQLLEAGADDANRELTSLIRDEVDRIVRLVERFEIFSDDAPPSMEKVNIHEVLDHVCRLASSGFAAHVRFVKEFDPSLPLVHGNRDLLVQALLNLVKNAAEALAENAVAPEIVLSTAYRPGVRFVSPSSGQRSSLPLEVCVVDNGPGVPEHLAEHLFKPFVTTKSYGTGLGLATVAKIVTDHGGVIECERVKRGTQFRILLPHHRDVRRDRD